MQPMLHYLSTSRACEGDGENSISTMLSPPSGALNIPPPRREGDNLSTYHRLVVRLTRSFRVCLQIMSKYWAEIRSNKPKMLNLPKSRLNITSE